MEREEPRERPAARAPVDEPVLRVKPAKGDVEVVGHVPRPVQRDRGEREAHVDRAVALGQESHLDAQQRRLVLVDGDPHVDVAAHLGLEGLHLAKALGPKPFADPKEPGLDRPLLAAAVEHVARKERERAHAQGRDPQPVVERLDEEPDEEARDGDDPHRPVDQLEIPAKPRPDYRENDPAKPAVGDGDDGGSQALIDVDQHEREDDRADDKVPKLHGQVSLIHTRWTTIRPFSSEKKR